MTKVKFGFTVNQWDSGTQYRHAEVTVNKVTKEDYSDYERVKRFASFTWQTDGSKRTGVYKLWYAMNTVPAAGVIVDVDGINQYAAFMRKLVRKTEWESLRSATPAQIIEALEAMNCRQMVHDRRVSKDVFIKEVTDINFQAFGIRDNSSGNLIKIFLTEHSEHARDQALVFMAERASGWDAESRKVTQLADWIAGGMEVETMGTFAPELTPANEIIDRGLTYIDYDENVIDGFGNKIETVDDEALADIGSALDEEE